ncbi:MAG: TonB family protein [Nitrospiraceae bacterium]
MTATNDNRFFVPAWGVSLALHGTIIGLAFAFAAQVKPILQENLFQWDVALVDTAKFASLSEPVESVMTPAQPMAKVAPPSRPKRVTEVSQVVRSLEQQIDSPPPIEQKVEPPQVREEPMEQHIVETATPVAEPAADARIAEPVAAALSEPTESRPVQQESVAMASAPVLSSEVPISQEKTVDAVAASGPEAKADNRWLAESLWRRVAELKRYPSLARLNGQEGKVILKAVIRSDGQLADVFVQKSSGYSTLDEAAIEAVKLACPLHMRHAIGKSQIVVSLPIVYSLAN